MRTELILEASSSSGKNPRLSSFVDSTFSRTRWLIILGRTQKAETNEVITTRRGKHERKYMLNNQEGKRLHTKNNQELGKLPFFFNEKAISTSKDKGHEN